LTATRLDEIFRLLVGYLFTFFIHQVKGYGSTMNHVPEQIQVDYNIKYKLIALIFICYS